MRIAVVGTGGVGGYFGTRLADSGQDVTFIARGAHLEAIQQNGLKLNSVLGDAHIKPAQATDDPTSVGPVDIVLVCVKTWHTREAAESARPLVGENTGVMSLQNGIQNERILTDVLGEAAVMGGLCRIISYIQAPGVIQHDSQMQTIGFGEMNGERTPRAEAFLAACEAAKIDVTLSDDIQRDIWAKFLLIAAFAGMTTLTRQPIGAVMEHQDTREMTLRVLQEVHAVGQAVGVHWADGAVDNGFKFLENLEPTLTTSMQRDLEAGNQMELSAINGAVVEMGREAGVDTPVNQAIYGALMFYESGRQTT